MRTAFMVAAAIGVLHSTAAVAVSAGGNRAGTIDVTASTFLVDADAVWRALGVSEGRIAPESVLSPEATAALRDCLKKKVRPLSTVSESGSLNTAINLAHARQQRYVSDVDVGMDDRHRTLAHPVTAIIQWGIRLSLTPGLTESPGVLRFTMSGSFSALLEMKSVKLFGKTVKHPTLCVAEVETSFDIASGEAAVFGVSTPKLPDRLLLLLLTVDVPSGGPSATASEHSGGTAGGWLVSCRPSEWKRVEAGSARPKVSVKAACRRLRERGRVLFACFGPTLSPGRLRARVAMQSACVPDYDWNGGGIVDPIVGTIQETMFCSFAREEIQNLDVTLLRRRFGSKRSTAGKYTVPDLRLIQITQDAARLGMTGDHGSIYDLGAFGRKDHGVLIVSLE